MGLAEEVDQLQTWWNSKSEIDQFLILRESGYRFPYQKGDMGSIEIGEESRMAIAKIVADQYWQVVHASALEEDGRRG